MELVRGEELARIERERREGGKARNFIGTNFIGLSSPLRSPSSGGPARPLPPRAREVANAGAVVAHDMIISR